MDLSARFEFRHSTRQILFGWGVRVELGRLAQQHGARRCAIVADAIFRDAPVLHALRDLLGTAGNPTAAVFWVGRPSGWVVHWMRWASTRRDGKRLPWRR